MIRVGVLGAGTMGRAHVHAYATIPEVDVVAVVASDHHRATLLAATAEAHSYDDVAEMLSSEKLDIVDCCLPTSLHRKMAELAFAHGCHEICESPLALTVDDGRAMIAAARAAGKELLVGQVVRFFPEYRRLAGAVRAGEIGMPVSLTMLRQGFYPSGTGNWYRDPSLSGGIFVDLMVHDFDWALQTLGPAQRVYARLVERKLPRAFAQGTATVRHRSGVLSQVTGTWGHPGPLLTMVEVSGADGLLRYHSGETQAFRVSVAAPAGSPPDVPTPDIEATENPYRTELAHFIDVIAGREGPILQAEESLAALALALAARASASTGEPLTLEAR